MHVPNQLQGKESKVKKTPLWTGSPLVSCSPPSKLLRSILASGIFPRFSPFLPLLTSTICLSSFSPAFNDMSKASSTSVSSAIFFYSLSPSFCPFNKIYDVQISSLDTCPPYDHPPSQELAPTSFATLKLVKKQGQGATTPTLRRKKFLHPPASHKLYAHPSLKSKSANMIIHWY